MRKNQCKEPVIDIQNSIASSPLRTLLTLLVTTDTPSVPPVNHIIPQKISPLPLQVTKNN